MHILGSCCYQPQPVIEFESEPLTMTLNGRTHSLAFSGELYNADPQTLLQGLAERGTACLQDISGVFAFAYSDGEALLLVRDRIGAKQLFYAVEDGKLRFGSQPKHVFALGLTPVIDSDSLREVLALGPARTPGCGVFRGLHEVLPAEAVHFDEKGLRRAFYWQLHSAPHTDSHDETVEKVSSLVYEGIKMQSVSEAPMCALLSGGLDSSLVTAIAVKQRERQLTTFSFDFAGNNEYYQANAFQPDRDTPFAREMAEYLGTKHIELTCDNTALADLLEPAMLARDLPGMADVDASLLYFCRIIGQEFKVALTGECADEIFGGYPWFRSADAFERRSFPWSDMQARRSFLREDVLDALELEGYAQAAYENSVAETPRCDADTAEEARRREIAWLNLRWFMQTLLNRMDCMACGLNGRVPLADHRLLEYVWNVPWAYKYKDDCVKYLLRMAGRGVLPENVLWRKKSPFPKTYNPQYERIVTARMRDILASPNEPVNSLIDRKKAEAFLSAPMDYGKPWYGQLMAAPQRIAWFLQLNAWLKQYGC